MRFLAILVLCTGLVAQSSDCTEILNQYTDDTSYWYGIGTSKIKRFRNNQAVDSASKQALENLSSKLNTRIESTALITTNETDNSTDVESLMYGRKFGKATQK